MLGGVNQLRGSASALLGSITVFLMLRLSPGSRRRGDQSKAKPQDNPIMFNYHANLCVFYYHKHVYYYYCHHNLKPFYCVKMALCSFGDEILIHLMTE